MQQLLICSDRKTFCIYNNLRHILLHLYFVLFKNNVFSYLATGERFQRLHYQFRLGATTIGLIINEVCTAIWKLLSPVYLPTPKEEDWIKISKEFYKIWNFPNCTGAIDGKHISI